MRNQHQHLVDIGHDPLKSGLHPRRVDTQQFLHIPDWHRAVAAKEIVGSCRRPGCGGFLTPIPTMHSGGEADGIDWYGAECNTCGTETTAPNGRVLRRSSRQGEMPDGWWPKRLDLLKKLKQLTQPNTEASD